MSAARGIGSFFMPLKDRTVRAHTKPRSKHSGDCHWKSFEVRGERPAGSKLWRQVNREAVNHPRGW